MYKKDEFLLIRVIVEKEFIIVSSNIVTSLICGLKLEFFDVWFECLIAGKHWHSVNEKKILLDVYFIVDFECTNLLFVYTNLFGGKRTTRWSNKSVENSTANDGADSKVRLCQERADDIDKEFRKATGGREKSCTRDIRADVEICADTVDGR